MPRLMLRIGVAGDSFDPHPYTDACERYGCMPAESAAQDKAVQRLRETAQTVVNAHAGLCLGMCGAGRLRDAIIMLQKVLKEDQSALNK